MNRRLFGIFRCSKDDGVSEILTDQKAWNAPIKNINTQKLWNLCRDARLFQAYSGV